MAQWPSFYSWCVILNTLSYITNLKYKLFGSTILKENSNHDNDDKADIMGQMFRVLLREIEDFKL